MAQPPLSAAIRKLERKLGMSLLERTSRRVTLTPAGSVLLEQGRVAVDGVAAAIGRARRAASQGDCLTVAAFVRTAADVAAGYHGDVPALAQRWLANWIAHFDLGSA